jgi:hypothetical protein
MKQLLVFLALVTLVFCQCTSTKCSDCISNTSCVYCVGSSYSSCQASSTVCNNILYTSNITNGGTCPPSCADPTNCGQCTSGVYVTAGCVWCNNSYSSCTQNTSCPAVVGNPIQMLTVLLFVKLLLLLMLLILDLLVNFLLIL